MKNKSIYTVITGASMGLGKALATECARRGNNLIIVALPHQNIDNFRSYLISTYNIKVVCFEADLTVEGEVDKIVNEINDKYVVDTLINNAGVGGSKSFQEASKGYVDNIVLLNIRATVMLTHGLINNLKQQKAAYILNISSMASFSPMPLKTVYPASKAFIYSFSRGLYAELKDTGIFVSVAHPGGMATNKEISDRINQHSQIVRSTILSPEKTAEICIRRLYKKDALIIPGIMNKVSYLFMKICPTWLQLICYRNAISKELQLG
ncbi:MAG: SDR family NAD(P)-dependent oxidoreductase [Hyphomicrobiales bacterium]